MSSTSCLAADHCSNETAHVAPQSPKSEASSELAPANIGPLSPGPADRNRWPSCGSAGPALKHFEDGSPAMVLKGPLKPTELKLTASHPRRHSRCTSAIPNYHPDRNLHRAQPHPHRRGRRVGVTEKPNSTSPCDPNGPSSGRETGRQGRHHLHVLHLES